MVETVVILNDFCHVNGGASRVAIETAVGLAQAGFDVKFLGAVGPISDQLVHPRIAVTCLEQSELIDFARQPSVALQGLWNLKAARAARRLFASCDPKSTVVHIHGWTKALTTSPMREAQRAGFRTVLTLHDFFAACPNGAFFNYQTQSCCPLRALSAQCLSTHCDKRSFSHKVYRVARRLAQSGPGGFPLNVDTYISLSNVSENLLRPYLAPNAQVFRLENMIDVPRAQPVAVAEHSNIVAVGRLDPEKGVELLVEAARLAEVRITFVGDGQLRAQVEQQPHCTVTGWMSPEGVLSTLRQARALVFASLWYETFGLVVSEANALGVPAIVSDVSAAAERVRHVETGWVFKAGDVNSLAEALRQLADDGAVARAGAGAYSQFWTDPPTRVRHVSQLQNVYASALR